MAHTDVRENLGEYTREIDLSLEKIFKQYGELGLYAHLEYFMGFRDEELNPKKEYGGKRFRSALSLMLGDWYGKRDAALPVTISIELFHNFTLIHDDIMDGDTLRRGRPTVWKKWGVPHAINDGDAQYFLSLRTVLESGLPDEIIGEILRFLTLQYLRVIEGQHMDLTLTDLPVDDSHVSLDTYLEMVGRKTADLIAAATKGAGIATGQLKEEQSNLFSYGHNLGIAYQLCDDLVSIWGSGDMTGKRLYGDILERKKTVPVLYALGALIGNEREALISTYNDKNKMSDTEAEGVIKLLESVGAYEYTRGLMEQYAQNAKSFATKLSLEEMQKEKLKNIVDLLLPDVKSV